jgi:hypothetical protein
MTREWVAAMVAICIVPPVRMARVKVRAGMSFVVKIPAVPVQALERVLALALQLGPDSLLWPLIGSHALRLPRTTSTGVYS